MTPMLAQTIPISCCICLTCGYDLSAAEMANEFVRCPECGSAFAPETLVHVHLSNKQGEPRSLSPHETIVAGPKFFFWMFWMIVLVGLAFVAVRG